MECFVISGVYNESDGFRAMLENALRVRSSIQIPDTEVQVCGKGKPEQIWDLKFRSKRIDLVKQQNHP